MKVSAIAMSVQTKQQSQVDFLARSSNHEVADFAWSENWSICWRLTRWVVIKSAQDVSKLGAPPECLSTLMALSTQT